MQDEGVFRMEWPPASSDLNPIEHLWDKLKQSVDARIGQETTLRDLPQVMVEAWEGIAQVRIRRLINSMHRAGRRVYTQMFEGTRFGGPGQKALPSMNEFTLSTVLWIFASSLYPRPIPLTYQPRICKDGFISIVFNVSPVCCLFDRALVDNRPLLQSLPTV